MKLFLFKIYILKILLNSSLISSKKKIDNPDMDIIAHKQQIYESISNVVRFNLTNIIGNKSKNIFITNCPEYLIK